MTAEALEQRLNGIAEDVAGMAVDLRLLREEVKTQTTSHETCMEHCRENRTGIYNRLKPLEEKAAVSTAKISLIWGIFGTVIGGLMLAGIVAVVNHMQHLPTITP